MQWRAASVTSGRSPWLLYGFFSHGALILNFSETVHGRDRSCPVMISCFTRCTCAYIWPVLSAARALTAASCANANQVTNENRVIQTIRTLCQRSFADIGDSIWSHQPSRVQQVVLCRGRRQPAYRCSQALSTCRFIVGERENIIVTSAKVLFASGLLDSSCWRYLLSPEGFCA